MAARKYTKEILEPIVARSISYAQVIRELGAKWSAGQQENIKRRIAEYNLDVSHFQGQASREGQEGYGRVSHEELLVLGEPTQLPVKSHRLKRAMLERGFTADCAECELGETWNGKPLTLQIDHVNGEKHDNRPENLRFLCPNCHSQTGTFGAKNIRGRGGMVDTLE